MKEIIGDDYPTYEDSVNATLAEKEVASALSYLTETESEINKQNLERLMKENFELKHRLSCVADDIELIDRHIQNNCNKRCCTRGRGTHIFCSFNHNYCFFTSFYITGS